MKHLEHSFETITDGKLDMTETVLNAYLLTQGVTLCRIGTEYKNFLCKTQFNVEVGKAYFFGANLQYGTCLAIDVLPDIEKLSGLPWVVAEAETVVAAHNRLNDWEAQCRRAIRTAEVRKRAAEITELLGADFAMPALEAPKEVD